MKSSKGSTKLTKEDKLSIIRLVIIAVVGLGLSVLFIFLYQKYHNIALTIITAILSFVFMSGSIIFINKKDKVFENVTNIAILFPLAYTIIVFIILLFIEQNKISGNPIIILDCFLWAVYTMPAFIIVIILLVLLMCALSYA